MGVGQHRDPLANPRKGTYPGLLGGQPTPLATATSGRNSRLLRYDQTRAAQEGVVLRHSRVPQTQAAAAGRDQPHIREPWPLTSHGTPPAGHGQWSWCSRFSGPGPGIRFEPFLSDLQMTRLEMKGWQSPKRLRRRRTEKKKKGKRQHSFWSLAAMFLVPCGDHPRLPLLLLLELALKPLQTPGKIHVHNLRSRAPNHQTLKGARPIQLPYPLKSHRLIVNWALLDASPSLLQVSHLIGVGQRSWFLLILLQQPFLGQSLR